MNNAKTYVAYGLTIAGTITGIISHKRDSVILAYTSGVLGATCLGVVLGEIIDIFTE